MTGPIRIFSEIKFVCICSVEINFDRIKKKMTHAGAIVYVGAAYEGAA